MVNVLCSTAIFIMFTHIPRSSNNSCKINPHPWVGALSSVLQLQAMQHVEQRSTVIHESKVSFTRSALTWTADLNNGGPLVTGHTAQFVTLSGKNCVWNHCISHFFCTTRWFLSYCFSQHQHIHFFDLMSARAVYKLRSEGKKQFSDLQRAGQKCFTHFCHFALLGA